MLKIRGLNAYRLTKELDITLESLTESLKANLFTPCLSHQRVSMGFIPVCEGSDQVAYPVAGGFVFRVQREEKILPDSVIKEEVKKRKKEIEAKTGKRPAGEEGKKLRDDTESMLLGEAFSRNAAYYAWINTDTNRLLVFTSSTAMAERITGTLRRAIGSLPAVPHTTNLTRPLCSLLASWLRGSSEVIPLFKRNGGVTLEDELAPSGGININSDISDDTLFELMECRSVRSVAMQLPNICTFVLHGDGTVSRLKFDGLCAAPADDESPITKFDADAHIFMDAVLKLMNELDFHAKIGIIEKE